MRRTIVLLSTMALTLLVACAVVLLAVSEEAGASFPGKNGRIAYNGNGVIYTINPDGSGKSKVNNTYVVGGPIDYSPNGKKITYMSHEGFNDGNPNGPPKDWEIYTINTDGTGQSRATNNRTNEYEPSYSPDGKRIVYYTGSHLRNP